MTTLRRMGLAALGLAIALLTSVSAHASDPKYLPGDTEWVFNLNFKQILESPLVKAQKEGLEQVKAMLASKIENEPIGKYIKDAGFDVFKDLHTVTMASSGGKDADFIMVEGNFNVDKIMDAVEDIAKNNGDAVKITKAGKRKLLEITPQGEKAVHACLVSNKVLIACSSKDGLESAIARAEGEKKSALKKEFKALLETTNDKQSISFAATGAALGKLVAGANVPNGDAVNTVLQGMDGVSLAITVAKDLQFQIGVNAKDEENAKKMAVAGNAGLQVLTLLATQKAQQDEKLAPLVDIAKTLRITSQGSNILIRGNASIEVIERLLKNLPNLPNQ